MEAIPYIMYSLLVGLLACWLLVQILAAEFMERRAACRQQLARRVVMLLATWLMEDRADDERLPLRNVVGGKLLLAELIAGVVAAVGCIDPLPLHRLVQQYALDEWLLMRATRLRGYRRARYLRLLAEIPHREWVADRVKPFLEDNRREVRFCAMLVLLTTYPERLVSLVGAFDMPIRGVEVAEILHLLRRGMVPIAYRPLLMAPNHNLRRVGLSLVAQFGIEEAEDLLLQLIATDERLSEQALGVLITLHRPLCRCEVIAHIACMTPIQRRTLLRMMAGEGYGVRTVRRLCRDADSSYYETLIGSYKRSLVCG